jgi:hypothetical protein
MPRAKVLPNGADKDINKAKKRRGRDNRQKEPATVLK